MSAKRLLYDHAKAMENIAADFEKTLQRYQSVHESTTQRFWAYIQDAKWNTSIFQNKTHLSPMDYSRVQDKRHLFKIPAYTAMAVGLQLSVDEVEAALRLSGLGYDRENREHCGYLYVLTSFKGCSIDECNEVLNKIGVPELGAKSRK